MAEKRRIPVFYIIYFILTAAAVSAMLWGSVWLKDLLAEYERAQPVHVADAVFEKYYESGNFERLAELTVSESSYDGVEAVAEYLHSQYDGVELTYNSVSSSEEGVLKYIVKAGDYKISSFTLRLNGEQTERGFKLYSEDSFELYLAADNGARIVAPESSDVYINGKLLGDEYIIESSVVRDSANSIPEGVPVIYYKIYEIDGLVRTPDISVRNGGVEQIIEYDPDLKEYEARLPNDSALEEEYGEYVLDAVKEYAKYMQNDSYWGAVSPYFDSTTALYASVRTVAQYYVYPHDGYHFEDESVSEFYAYDDNTFSCRVSVLQVLELAGREEDYTDLIDMTVYLRRVGDRFLIFDWNLYREG